MAYSSGLSISELVALKKEYAGLSRKVIYIKAGKSRKNRCTVLSERAARICLIFCVNAKIFLERNPFFPELKQTG
jgi:site-specific recombinase XerD